MIALQTGVARQGSTQKHSGTPQTSEITMTSEQLDATEQVVIAFANECGGPVLYQLAGLMQAPTSRSNGVLFEKLSTATKDLFIQNGKTAAEHLLWLSTKMPSACSKIYWQLFSALNPTHNHDLEDAVVITDAKTRIPHVTLEQLAIIAAEDFLSPEESSRLEPNNTGKDQAKKDPTKTRSEATALAEKPRKQNRLEVHPEQLHGQDLTRNQVVDWYMNKYQKPKVTKNIELHLESLTKAAERASKGLLPGPLQTPVKASTRGKWKHVAVVHKGPGSGPG